MLKRNPISYVFAALLVCLVAGCGDELPTSPIKDLEKIDVTIGTGAEANAGDSITVHYSGYLYSESAPDHRGTLFDSTITRGEPIQFRLGVGILIEGWEQGIPGMRVGGRRTLIIPPEMAYGRTGFGDIPPNAALIFDIELLAVN